MQAGQASQMIINTESKASESHHAQAQKYPISIHTSSTTVFSRCRGPFSSPFSLNGHHEHVLASIMKQAVNFKYAKQFVK